MKTKKVDFKTIFPYLGFVGVVLFFQIFSGNRVFTAQNFKAIVNEVFFIIIGVTGYIFIMAQGNLDFSIGSLMGLCCAAAVTGANIHPILAIPVAIAVGAAGGLLSGFVHAKLKLGSLVGTMATQYVIGGILLLWLDGGTKMAPLGMLQWNTMTLKVIVILVVVFAGLYVYNYTSYGKYSRAIGSCQEAARQTVVNVPRIKIMSFVIMGCLAGLLGFFSLIRTGTATVTTGSDLFMNVLCAALLGGIPLSGGYGAKFSSVIIGSLTMAFLSNGMVLLGVGTYDKQLIKGIVFLITIAISFDRKNLVAIK